MYDCFFDWLLCSRSWSKWFWSCFQKLLKIKDKENFIYFFKFSDKWFSLKKLEIFFSRFQEFQQYFLSLMPKMSQFIAESAPNRVKLTYNALICHYFDLGDMNWRLFGRLKKRGDFGAKAWRHGLSTIWQHRMCTWRCLFTIKVVEIGSMMQNIYRC